MFMVFNNYTAAQTTNGHKYSGFVQGGPCENKFGKGYAVIVDQGEPGEEIDLIYLKQFLTTHQNCNYALTMTTSMVTRSGIILVLPSDYNNLGTSWSSHRLNVR